MEMTKLPRVFWPSLESDVLGLEPEESDPVAIILAAQLRLRRHRRQPARTTGEPEVDVRQIYSTRDAMLRRAIARCSCMTDGRGVSSNHAYPVESR
jgi:hypothetical protein